MRWEYAMNHEAAELPLDTEVASGAPALHAKPPAADGPEPLLTVIVPTRNERDTVPALLPRLAAALDGLGAEVLFVDDSDDDTPAELARHAAACALPVRVLHRTAGVRAGGLGTAVLAGMREARGRWLLVMDGDLQHPPESAAALARTAMRQDVDIVIGTRYAGAGASGGLDGAGRAITSSVATRVSKALFPV